MKKFLVLLLTFCLCLSACSNKKENMKKNESLKVGILQYIEHPALDSAREGFVEKVKNSDLNIEIDYQNAQGDVGVARTIAEKFVSDKVDLIFAIATPAAEAASAATSDIPILFSAVTDPVAAHLVESLEKPGGNVTGTSDSVDIKSQLELFKNINENIKTIGFIYSADEANSLVQLEEIETAAKDLGCEIKAFAIQNISDLPQIAESAAQKSDAVYIPTDNKVASSVSLLAEILKEKKIPSVGAEESHVKSGALISNGINYEELGKQTGKMAEEILKNEKSPSEIPVESSKNFTKVFNSETLNALSLDRSLKVFEDAKDIKN